MTTELITTDQGLFWLDHYTKSLDMLPKLTISIRILDQIATTSQDILLNLITIGEDIYQADY